MIAEVHAQLVGVHLYPLSDCGSPAAVTVPRLLSVESADAPETLAWVVSAANGAGLPAIISEANSAACGGKAGVSDAPPSAVWAVRFVLSALKTGFREVRFHLSGGPYDPFVMRGTQVSDAPARGRARRAQPLVPGRLHARAPFRAPRASLATAGHRRPVQLILDNEHARAQTVTLPFSSDVQAEVLLSTRRGFAHVVLPARHGSVKVKILPESIVAILSS